MQLSGEGKSPLQSMRRTAEQTPSSHFEHDRKAKRISIQVMYPKLSGALAHGPQHRFISAVEQTVELPQDIYWQYLVIAAPSFANIAFKVPSWILKLPECQLSASWDIVRRQYTILLNYGK